MKTARVKVSYPDDKIRELEVTIGRDNLIKSEEGEILPESGIKWLPPVKEPGTIFALGLNYVDHASELSFKPPEEPLVFIKGTNCLTGHLQHSYRPDNVDFMHYECELVVVIGKKVKKIRREEAMSCVRGYMVGNDFAVRDYLENYYRPNLRVKSRDSLFPVGPWLVDAGDIANVNNLKLTTRVNGIVTQEGTTADMIFDIPTLVEYLSQIMTLYPGDMIATGTPKGLKDVQPGDIVDCEIENIGILTTTIVSEKDFYGDDY